MFNLGLRKKQNPHAVAQFLSSLTGEQYIHRPSPRTESISQTKGTKNDLFTQRPLSPILFNPLELQQESTNSYTSEFYYQSIDSESSSIHSVLQSISPIKGSKAVNFSIEHKDTNYNTNQNCSNNTIQVASQISQRTESSNKNMIQTNPSTVIAHASAIANQNHSVLSYQGDRESSLFYSNIIKPKINNTLPKDDVDIFAWNNSDRYPVGDICFSFHQQERPQIDWASKYSKTRKEKWRWKCLGIFICPSKGCDYRCRPKAPRWGKSMYSSKGKIPSITAKDQCPEHEGTDLVYQSCDAEWIIKEHEDDNTNWIVKHYGDHNHKAPIPIHATPLSKKKLQDIISIDPKVTTQDLALGNDIRSPMGEVDLSFARISYLNHCKIEERKKVYNYVQGHEKAFDSLDTTFEFFDQLNQKDSDVIRRVCMISKESPMYISFQTTEMEKLSVDPNSAKETDTIMSITETLYFKKEVYVTMTSAWNNILQREFPCLVTIHTGMDGSTFKTCHFDVDNASFDNLGIEFNSLEDLYNKYPGCTMDFSTALAKGWLDSLNDLIRRRFGTEAVASQLAKEALLRMCSVHFKGNAQKVSKITDVVPLKRRYEFKQLCWSLLENSLEFYQFEAIVKKICNTFPNAKGWMKWYLRQNIAPHIFPACNSVQRDSDLKNRLQKLSKSTNAQEGLGGSLKKYLKSKKNLPNELVQGIFAWVRLLTQWHQLGKQGKFLIS